MDQNFWSGPATTDFIAGIVVGLWLAAIFVTGLVATQLWAATP